MDEQQRWEETLRKTISWFAVLGTGLFAAASFYVLLDAGLRGAWNEVTLQHLPSIVGLPSAAIASLGLVLLLRTVAGNIEAKFLGLEFKGAAGPIIMWILCFLAITLAINKTWNLEQRSQRSNGVETSRQ